MAENDATQAVEQEDDPWVIRTDFTSDAQWSRICNLIAAPVLDGGETLCAYVRFVDNPAVYSNKSPTDVVSMLPDSYPDFFCFIVDKLCFQNAKENPILVVGFESSSDMEERASSNKPNRTEGDIQTFRAVPSTIQCIQNNLSIGNMDFDDFSESVEQDGVFRGFPRWLQLSQV